MEVEKKAHQSSPPEKDDYLAMQSWISLQIQGIPVLQPGDFILIHRIWENIGEKSSVY